VLFFNTVECHKPIHPAWPGAAEGEDGYSNMPSFKPVPSSLEQRRRMVSKANEVQCPMENDRACVVGPPSATLSRTILFAR
jgi:hypothetical protein